MSMTVQGRDRCSLIASLVVLIGCIAGAAAADDAPPIPEDDATLEILSLEDRRESNARLHGFLSHPRADVRARAALAVGRIGRVEDVPRIAPLLGDDDALVRRWAAFGLGEIEDSTAAVPLIDHLRNGLDTDDEVRQIAVEALGKLGQGAEACRSAFRDLDADVRARALLAAWQIPVPEVANDVLPFLSAADPELRWRAAYCLMRYMGAPASGRTPISGGATLTDEERPSVERALRTALADEDPRVRMQATRGLRRVGSPEVTRALAALRGDPDWRVRVEAVRALASPVDPVGAGAAGGGSTDAGTNDAEGGTAGDVPTRRQVDLPVLLGFLEDPNPNVRVTVAEALANLGERGHAIGVLQGLTQSSDPRLIAVAAASLTTRLGTVTDADSLDAGAAAVALCDRLLASDHWTVRAAAMGTVDLLPSADRDRVLRTLVADVGPVAKLAVGEYLEDRASGDEGSLWDRIGLSLPSLRAHEDPMVQLMTAYGVAALFDADSVYHPTPDDRDALDELIAATYRNARHDPALVDLREAAVDLASSRTDRAVPRALLETACDDDDYVVRRAAVAALEAADLTPPRPAAPVETGREPRDYRHIVRWANVGHEAFIDTEAGRIVVRLFSREAPLTVWNFAQLANQGFYDDGAWHRVVPNFVLQDGCPRGDGWGGPDHRIRCEINRRSYETGRLGMALSGKDTGGSQFFFTHSPQPHLDGRYTIFGEITSGHDVADLVTQGMPILSIRVLDAEVEG